MGDVEDPSMGLNKMLHGGATAEDGAGMSTGFGVVDQGHLGFDSGNINQISHKFNEKHGLSNLSLTPPSPPSLPAAAAMFSGQHHQKVEDPHSPFVSRFNSSQIHLVDVKPQLVINQGSSFDRAAFYFKEALQLLIHSVVNNMNPIASPFSLKSWMGLTRCI
ncbi:hypothetical protein Hdeb2414_s0150g00815121 [Helianthus debilis subsp. tardiflorus]